MDESAHICLMENMEVVYLFRVESRHPDRLLTQIGRKNPIHCTSEGLCILAFQDKGTINQLLQSKLYSFTPCTPTDPDKLLALISDIRQNDYCLLRDAYYENYTSIAAQSATIPEQLFLPFRSSGIQAVSRIKRRAALFARFRKRQQKYPNT